MMKKWIIIPAILLISGCKEKLPESYFTPEKANAYIKKIEGICNSDNGKLWGKNLYGPVIFVDRNSRRIFSNSPDNEGNLKLKDGIYTGFFPRELVINNRAVNFGGKVFGIAPLPSTENEYNIISNAIHGLFHRYQEISGFTSSGYKTPNMEEKNARIWLKCEWKALRKAVISTGADQKVAVRDALVFRGANHELYQSYVPDEVKFETYEGTANFTFMLLSTTSNAEFTGKLMDNLDRIYKMQSYSRTYGSILGALYTTLLYQKGFALSGINSENTDLGELVRKSFEIELPEVCRDVAGSLAFNYDLDSIRTEEVQREQNIHEWIHSKTIPFTEKPVVLFELESPYFDFEPEHIHPMDSLGTLYDKLRVADNWGKLSVDKGGCLIANNFRSLRISARGCKVDKDHITGEGWTLLLNNDWQIISVNQNYIVRRAMP